ncbi:MAG TPA: DUF485 domain-containing protein [Abditibacteriaceae bacterium]|jgi:uncharacterized membrane protein (DUF485 family)
MSTEYASADSRHDSTRASQLVASAPFQELQRSRARVATILTILTLAAYFSFFLCMAFAPHVLAQRVSGVVLGIPFGIGVIIWSWLLTGIYVRWANTSYDALVAQVKEAAKEVKA